MKIRVVNNNKIFKYFVILQEENLHSHNKKGFNNIKDLKPYMREIDVRKKKRIT